MYKTILVLKIGKETCCDPSNNGTLVVQHDLPNGDDYRILVVGGMLPNGEEEHYCQNLLDAMAYVANHVRVYGAELVEG
jgi:hypothetical protein